MGLYEDWMKNKSLLERPSWNDYFMALTFLVAQRSFDASTKCGCVIVDDCNSILTTGYNGPVRGSDDKSVTQERPAKYEEWEHSERNAIYTAARNGVCLKNSKAYVTGLPCVDCLRAMFQSGVVEIVYGQNTAVMNTVITPMHQKLLDNPNVKISKVKNEDFLDLFTKAQTYCRSKIPPVMPNV